jgi:nitrous oxide reductase accessory protein NosL
MTAARCALSVSIVAAALSLTACSRDDDGPPTIRLGDSPCTYCNMIISDERFATATVIESDRGPEPLLFDDFICQLDYEKAHPDLTIVTRWSHDYNTREWFPAADAFFVRSEKILAPMASHLAAFESKEDADKFAKEVEGETVGFESVWQRD